MREEGARRFLLARVPIILAGFCTRAEGARELPHACTRRSGASARVLACGKSSGASARVQNALGACQSTRVQIALGRDCTRAEGARELSRAKGVLWPLHACRRRSGICAHARTKRWGASRRLQEALGGCADGAEGVLPEYRKRSLVLARVHKAFGRFCFCTKGVQEILHACRKRSGASARVTRREVTRELLHACRWPLELLHACWRAQAAR